MTSFVYDREENIMETGENADFQDSSFIHFLHILFLKGMKKRESVWYKNDPFLNNPRFSQACKRNLLNTLCEKEKMLVTSIFSFSHNVFYPINKKKKKKASHKSQ